VKQTRAYALALSTAPNLKTARRLARTTLNKRLAACVSLVPRIESHYWWQGRVERGAEVLLLFKTSRRRVAALEKHLLAQHPYDTPEFLALPIAGGAARYLAWITESLDPPR
jgi:periplasmic divalent cation tolerance protein